MKSDLSGGVQTIDVAAQNNYVSNRHSNGYKQSYNLNDYKTISPPETIVKRDGRQVPFDAQRIETALLRCFSSLKKESQTAIPELTQRAVNIVSARFILPSVEQIQDTVETVLQAAGEYEAAKHYILYRAEHAKLREVRPIPDNVRQAFTESDQYFPTQLQKFQFYDKYARFNYEHGRRETWIEAVERSVNFLAEISESRLSPDIYERVRHGILTMKAMPSSRLLAMAGPAARRNNVAIYNCSYQPVDSIDAFVEALLISMNGCGVGYSVESHYVENLPRVRRQRGLPPKTFTIEDTTEGWAVALRIGLETWLDGGDIRFNYTELRPAGAPLYTKGGRSSGPEPLRAMLDFVRSRILARQGSVLRPLDAHDIMCSVGNAAVSGGVRRTAMISLFDWDDNEMRECKNGNFESDNSQRWNANNSAVWPEGGLSQIEIINQMLEMVKSGRGEPGIFNRPGTKLHLPSRRMPADFGTNPCGEIILRPRQFCNLTIAVARADDTFESLKEKVELASILGTIQSMATHFPNLRSVWRENCEEERLLGVDITGQMDSPITRDPEVLAQLQNIAIETNRMTAESLGINPSVAITCNKPSGNSSVMLNCAPGIHARWSPYYIRNVRVGTHTPMFKILRDAGVPMDPENGQTPESATSWVVHFPVKGPEGAITRTDVSALDQCENWLRNKIHWTEHNPSVTITYRPDEVLDMIRWVWEHKEIIGGMSFLPAFDAKYDQMPYVDISEKEYVRLNSQFPAIDFAKLYLYEEEDLTTAAQEFACSAGICDVL